MAKKIVFVVRIVVLSAKSYVTLFVKMHFEWVPRGYYCPDADVKLPIFNKKWFFDVFLDYPGFLGYFLSNIKFCIMTYFLPSVKYFYFSASTQPSWFYYPLVVGAVYHRLRIALLQI